jgi:tripartite motif-containing protein 71
MHSSSLHDQLVQQLTCAICLELYSNPRILPDCQHTFCLHCLKSYVESGQNSTCPTCRHPIQLLMNRELSSYIPNDFKTQALLDTLIRDYQQQQQEHIVPLMEEKNCVFHRNQELKLYCRSCDDVICRDCVESGGAHKNHDYVSIENIIGQEYEHILQLMNNASQYLPQIDRMKLTIQDRIKHIDLTCRTEQNRVNEMEEMLIRLIRDRSEQIRNDIVIASSSAIKSLKFEGDELAQLKQHVHTTINNTKESYDNNNHVALMQMKKQLVQNNETIENILASHLLYNDEHVEANLNSDGIVDQVQKWGHVNIDNLEPSNCIASGTGINKVEILQFAKFVIQTKSIQGNIIRTGGHNVQVTIYSSSMALVPANITDNKNGAYTVTYTPTQSGPHRVNILIDNHHISGSPYSVLVYKKRTTYRCVKEVGSLGLSTAQFQEPHSVTVSPHSGNIFVCDALNHRLQVFNSSGEFITQIGSYGSGLGQFNYPTSIAIADGRIRVCDFYNHRIQVLLSDGRPLTKFGSEGTANGQFDGPWGIAVYNSDRIVVTDCYNHRVQMFDKDGQFVTKFGSEGFGEGQFQYPHGVAIHDDGTIYICDTNNHRIQVFDMNGQLVRIFGRMGKANGQFQHPHNIAIDLDGSILVTDYWNHRIQIFTRTGQYLRQFGEDGARLGQFDNPIGIAVNTSNGSIIVSEKGNQRFQIIQ